MNTGAPARGRTFAGQELRPQAEHDQMKAETPLRNVSLHDPIKNEAKGFPGESVGNAFHFRLIQAGCGIIAIGTKWKVAWPDHDNFACCRAF